MQEPVSLLGYNSKGETVAYYYNGSVETNRLQREIENFRSVDPDIKSVKVNLAA